MGGETRGFKKKWGTRYFFFHPETNKKSQPQQQKICGFS